MYKLLNSALGEKDGAFFLKLKESQHTLISAVVYLKEKFRIKKNKKNTHLGGCSIDPILHLSPGSSVVRTKWSNTTDCSVLPLCYEQRAITVSQWFSPLQRSLNWWAVEGAGRAGSGSQWIAERLSHVLIQASGQIPTVWSGSFQSLDWLCDGPQECRINCTSVIYRRIMAKITSLSTY